MFGAHQNLNGSYGLTKAVERGQEVSYTGPRSSSEYFFWAGARWVSVGRPGHKLALNEPGPDHAPFRDGLSSVG